MIIKIIITALIFIPINFIEFTSDIYRIIAFAIPYILIGHDVLLTAGKNILKGDFLDENFLMAIASLGAFALGEFPEGVAVILLYQIGEAFQRRAVDNSKGAIKSLLDIKAEYAMVMRNGQAIKVNPKDLQLGETIIIKPGEKVPVDCKIIEGSTSLDTSALTGESMPQDKSIDDDIYSGSININGVIKAKTSKLFKNSEVSKILELVENSADKKAKAEKFITKFSKVYTPIVVAIAAVLAILPPITLAIYHNDLSMLASFASWSTWIERALILLVISCPCALVISVPLSFFIGIGNSSKNGVLIKGSNYMEVLANIDTLVFDKTGTLTEGKFEVTAIHPNHIEEKELLKIAALAEGYSNHPIAESIVQAYDKLADIKLTAADITAKNLQEYAGMGIEAEIAGKTYFLGNEKLMKKVSSNFEKCKLTGTIIHISNDNNYLGHIVIADKIKETTANALNDIKSLGINKTVMLTGDSQDIAKEIAGKLSLDEVHSELLPGDKVQIVEDYLSELADSKRKHLAFVGDGINDAAVLTRSDVGIAMGAIGSDAAIEAADVVIMDDNLEKIPTAIKIARKTMIRVKQNIICSLAVKVLILILGVFGIANMWLAIFADVGVLILAVFNSIRK